MWIQFLRNCALKGAAIYFWIYNIKSHFELSVLYNNDNNNDSDYDNDYDEEHWFLRIVENRSTRRKSPRSRVNDRTNKLEPTYDAESGNRKLTTLVKHEW